jgi:hypothetical protein
LEPVKSTLEKKNIEFEVLIDDIQRAIDEENPFVDDEDDLDGKKGMS